MASMSVFLNVSDLERSLAFYQALGFKVSGSWEGDGGVTHYADLEYEGAELSLGHIPAVEDPEFQEWVGSPLGAGVMVTIVVDRAGDVDAIHERAAAAGATVEHPPEDRPYGRVCTVNDPDGYVVSFIKEP